jgi:hypothetical protein
MTNYIIRSNPLLGTPNIYGWSQKDGGQVRCDELQEFITPLAAAWAMAALPERTVRFYQLEVQVAPPPARYPFNGDHGWMLRHPGYDLMH